MKWLVAILLLLSLFFLIVGVGASNSIAIIVGLIMIILSLISMVFLNRDTVKIRNNELPKEHDCFEMLFDLNPVIKKGMQGVILMSFNDGTYLVEFVKEDATNYDYEGQDTFLIKDSDFKITWVDPRDNLDT